MRKIIILFSFILFSINFSTAQVCDKINGSSIPRRVNKLRFENEKKPGFYTTTL